MPVPAIRIRALNDAARREEGDYVLYWMIMNRRADHNFTLDRAVELCLELGKPLIVFEALRNGYEWASDRIHRFVLQGMAENRRRFASSPAAYYAYVEPTQDHGKGLLAALADRACVIVTDDFPCFFIPKMLTAIAPRLSVRCEAIDSNGLFPMRATDRVFARAHDFRRFLQKNLVDHLDQRPAADPFGSCGVLPLERLPANVTSKWPEATDETLVADRSALAKLPIDHSVLPASVDGGTTIARERLERFLTKRIDHYAEDRSRVDVDVTSGLSPYLHFGHLSVHEVFAKVEAIEEWTTSEIVDRKATGSREGWWQMSPAAESFLDELITWREVGYNMCWQREDYDQYESLPEWAQKTLADHAGDPRPHLYTEEQLEAADTHDALWNAAQVELVSTGRMQNYLRMLWGKKILEWSESPQKALQTLIQLNNKYAIDGRNPNSYSGIFWCLGRYDRAWGPERPIFGKIRYMSSENTARKFNVKSYIEQFSPNSQQSLF